MVTMTETMETYAHIYSHRFSWNPIHAHICLHVFTCIFMCMPQKYMGCCAVITPSHLLWAHQPQHRPRNPPNQVEQKLLIKQLPGAVKKHETHEDIRPHNSKSLVKIQYAHHHTHTHMHMHILSVHTWLNPYFPLPIWAFLRPNNTWPSSSHESPLIPGFCLNRIDPARVWVCSAGVSSAAELGQKQLILLCSPSAIFNIKE